MIERELIEEFNRQGLEIKDPAKFYAAISRTSLETVLNEIKEAEKNIPITKMEYSQFEELVFRHIGRVMGAVNNHRDRSLDTSSFLDYVRTLSSKYVVSDFIAASEELASIDAEIEEPERRLRELENKNNELNRQLRELTNNREISGIERNTRTFAIINELHSINGEIPSLKARVKELQESKASKTRELEEIKAKYNNSTGTKTPDFNLAMRDSFIEELKELEKRALAITSNPDDIKTIEHQTTSFINGVNYMFANTQSATTMLDTLYANYGIGKTSTLEIKPEEVVRTISNPKVPEKEAKSVEVGEAIAKVEESKPETDKKEEPKLVTFIGRHYAYLTSEFDALEEGKEYRVIDEDESTYRLEGLESISFNKNAFVNRALWDSIVAFGPLMGKEAETAEPIEEVVAPPVEPKKASEKTRVEVTFDPELFQVGKEVVFFPSIMAYINEDGKLTSKDEAEKKLVTEKSGMIEGQVYKIEEIDGPRIKLEGINGFYGKFIFESKEAYKTLTGKEAVEIVKAAPVIEEESPLPKPAKEETKISYEHDIYKVGEEIVFRPVASLTPDEKDYFEEVFIKNGVEEGLAYKITEVTKDGVKLEGIDIELPQMGFMSKKVFEAMPETVRKIKILGVEEKKTPEIDKSKPELTESENYIQYTGEDNGKLIKGHRYSIGPSFGSVARLRDMETGQIFTIDDYDPKMFNHENDLSPNPVENREKQSERKLPEIIAVEKLDKLKKMSNRLATIGVGGLMASGFLAIALGPAIMPIAIGSIASIVGAAGSNTKFARSQVLTNIFRKTQSLVNEYKDKLDGENSLSQPEIESIKGEYETLKESLLKIQDLARQQKVK